MNPIFIILKKQFKDTFKNKSILIQVCHVSAARGHYDKCDLSEKYACQFFWHTVCFHVCRNGSTHQHFRHYFRRKRETHAPRSADSGCFSCSISARNRLLCISRMHARQHSVQLSAHRRNFRFTPFLFTDPFDRHSGFHCCRRHDRYSV